jgi:large subunit ribosomal protein L9
MKVLLQKDVDNLGYAGEVHNVADGFGRNYLIPRGLAVRATPSVLKQAAAWRARAEMRRAEQRSQNEALADRIHGLRFNFHARAGEGGRLYGSVTMMDIANRLNEQLGADIDRRKFDSQPLRDLGDHTVTIHLDREFHPQIHVSIHPEEGEEAVRPAADVETDEAAGPDAVVEMEEAGDEDDYYDEFDLEDELA